jgi:hypothetical protein
MKKQQIMKKRRGKEGKMAKNYSRLRGNKLQPVQLDMGFEYIRFPCCRFFLSCPRGIWLRNQGDRGLATAQIC